MVQSYIALGDFFNNESSYSSTAFNSYSDFAELGRTPPKTLTLEHRFEHPRPAFNTYLSESESDEEYEFDMALLDLPPELFLSSIFPQMSLRTLGAFAGASTWARNLVEMYQNWDVLYAQDFGDAVAVEGSGFSRYLRRACAQTLVSANLAKGADLEHCALKPLNKMENDILHMSLNHHANKTYQSPFKALQAGVAPLNSWAAPNLVLNSDHQVAQVTSEGTLKVLECSHNSRITQLTASFALSAEGTALRVVFDDKRNLTLEPLAFEHPIYYIQSIKNRVYALVESVGLVTWLSGDEQEYDLVLSASERFGSLAVYEHNYGSMAEVALTTNDCIYTLQFDRSANSVGIHHTLEQCRCVEAAASKVVYYEDGTFFVVGNDGSIAKLARGQLTVVPSLTGIADLVVSKVGFCMALTREGTVLAWDCRGRRAASTWAIGTTVKGTKVPISCPVKAKIEGVVTSIFCCDTFAFAQVV